MTAIIAADVSRISKAVEAQLTSYPSLAEVSVERSADRNLDPNACPWIGIYRLGAQFAQRVLGYGGGIRDQRVRFLVLIEHADQSSGNACEDALEGLVKEVVQALLSDTTLGGAVSTLEDFDVDYTDYQRSGNVFMQTAALQFVAVTNTAALS